MQIFIGPNDLYIQRIKCKAFEKDQQELVEAHQKKINMLPDECAQVSKTKYLKQIYIC